MGFPRCLVVFAAIAAGCSSATTPGDAGQGVDLCFWGCGWGEGDLAGTNGTNECGDFDPSCTDVGFGPGKGAPFPLPSDMPADPNAGSEGVGRDKNGYLGLDASRAGYDYLWLANEVDWGRGTVTKLDSKGIREVARYFTVTCGSNAGGSSQACDGMNGCCARDSYPQLLNRKNNMAQGPYQQVNLLGNYPSRTAVDFDGDVWVANRAYGTQTSVSKVAGAPDHCIDRNQNGRIDTSSDENHDGVIQTDCNDDGLADDLVGVKMKPCTNGLRQEFYGLDDECVLFTTNTNVPGQCVHGCPVALGPGPLDFGPSDVWAATYNDGHVFDIDGTTGVTKRDLTVGNQPYGITIDASAIGWVGPLMTEGPLCWFDTKTLKTGTVRQPQGSTLSGYGIALDRDQNIWLGALAPKVSRYTPDRSAGLARLGDGYWTVIQNPGANEAGGAKATWGIAVDSRTANQYWAWTYASSHIVRLPGSDLPLPNGKDVTVDGLAYPATFVPGSNQGRGVGVDRDQNVWGIAMDQTIATRIKVDAKGVMSPPDLVSPPMGNNKCPAGDRCPYTDRANAIVRPYTYSDFTGFGLRNFTRPKGYYNYVQKGCSGGAETKWVAVQWDADIPLNTTITMRARAGNTPVPDLTWGAWTFDFAASPADLINGMPLIPNEKDSEYIQVEFDFATMDRNVSPKLKSFDILYECIGYLD